MNNPLQECALFFHLKFIDGIIVLALKSNIETGSPKYLILSGLVLVSSVILLAKSLDTFLPTSVPKALNNPLSTISRCACSYSTSKTCSYYFVLNYVSFLNNGGFIFPETVGAPNDLDWTIPKGLLPSFLYCFSNDKAIVPPKEWLQQYFFMMRSVVCICRVSSCSDI